MNLPTVDTAGERRIPRPWRLAQTVSVAAAVTVVGLLVLRPELGLYLTWSVLIPVVPALLLFAPRVWRNLCPISVVHQLPVSLGRGGRRRLGRRAQWLAPAVAITGLFLIVPLRHVIFNESGMALAGFVLVVLAVGLLGGALFAGKSGWCSTFCPVGPVEKLYGQQPALHPSHAHCETCVGCTDACFDRRGASAVEDLLGASGPDGLLRTPTGVFTGAFPGFVVGYFTADPTGGASSIYLHVALLSLASLALFVLVHRISGTGLLATARAAAALAAAAYYWFTVPAVIGATEAVWGLGPAPPILEFWGRAFFLALVAFWWLSARRRVRSAIIPAGTRP
ncbi:MAG: 4Fe-4S binding protein [Gemmatimonadota bacterium]